MTLAAEAQCALRVVWNISKSSAAFESDCCGHGHVVLIG